MKIFTSFYALSLKFSNPGRNMVYFFPTWKSNLIYISKKTLDLVSNFLISYLEIRKQRNVFYHPQECFHIQVEIFLGFHAIFAKKSVCKEDKVDIRIRILQSTPKKRIPIQNRFVFALITIFRFQNPKLSVW